MVGVVVVNPGAGRLPGELEPAAHPAEAGQPRQQSRQRHTQLQTGHQGREGVGGHVLPGQRDVQAHLVCGPCRPDQRQGGGAPGTVGGVGQ